LLSPLLTAFRKETRKLITGGSSLHPLSRSARFICNPKHIHLMTSKTKKTTSARTTKPSASKVMTRTKALTKKATATTKAKATPKRAAVRPASRVKTGKKNVSGLMRSVKEGVQTGLHAVTDLVKKVTPDALLPRAAKPKRK
jgi:hypothetical protein